MHKFTIINNKKIDILVDKLKVIIGNDYEAKDKIYRVIVNFFNKLSLSDFAKENNQEINFYFDDSPLRIADFDFYLVSDFFDIDLDSKLGLKSISLSFLNKLFENVEYNEEFNTINTLLNDMLDDLLIDVDIKFKPLLEATLNKKTLIKLLNYSFLQDESTINNYDLSLKDKIIIQLEMLSFISKKSEKKNLILLKIPYLDDEIMKLINKINGYLLILVENVKTIVMNNDICILNDNNIIDLADDNAIFELCNNSNSYLTIKEMKEKLITDYLKIYN